LFQTVSLFKNILGFLSKGKKKLDKNLKIPFIKGIINNKTEITKNTTIINNNAEHDSWLRSHGGYWNTKYHSGKQINLYNINKLKLVWKYTSIKKKDLDKKYIQNIQLNPVFVDNKLIAATPDWKIIALDAQTGKLLWQLQSLHPPGRRGMLIDLDKASGNKFLYIPLGGRIYKINTNNGDRDKKFGKNGSIEASTIVAPMIFKNKLVIAGPGIISIFNLNNGNLIKTFSLHPNKKNFLMGNVWGGAALDEEKGIVFVNTGNPHPGVYGVNRPGDNKNSSSIIAFDIRKEKILWTFQETEHDLWDFDIPSPPILHNLNIDNNIYEVVISVSKTGNTIILERNTGKPIFDITYKRAPKSTLAGEYAAPFQIYLEKPERFSKIEFSLNDINKLSKDKQNEIKKKLKNSKFGWYETPSFDKDLITFGLHGGAQWTGAAIDPIKQFIYIPVNNVSWKVKPFIQSREIKTNFSNKIKEYHKIYLSRCSSCHGKNRNGIHIKKGEREIKNIPSLVGFYTIKGLENKMSSIDNINENHNNINLNSDDLLKFQILFKEWDKILDKKNEIKIEGNGLAWTQFLTSDGTPASNPPWGYIAKLDLVSGKILWKAPHGYIDINNKKTKVGTTNFGGLALNASGILFFTGTEDSKSYAINSITGEELWSFQMEAAGSAPPIIFKQGKKQYVSFVSTGGTYWNYKEKSSTIYTFTIVD